GGRGGGRRPGRGVVNKCALSPAPPFGIEDERVVAVFRLSCATGEGLEEFRRSLFALVPEPEVEEPAPDDLPEFLVYRPAPKTRPWTVFRTERGFRVVGTPPGDEELARALPAAGANRGASVEIGEETLELA